MGSEEKVPGGAALRAFYKTIAPLGRQRLRVLLKTATMKLARVKDQPNAAQDDTAEVAASRNTE